MSIEFLWICANCDRSNVMSKWKCESCNCTKSVDSCVKMFKSIAYQHDQNVLFADAQKTDATLSDTNHVVDENNDSSFLSEKDDENEQNAIDNINKAKTMMKICKFIMTSKFEGMSDNDITEKSKNFFNNDFPFHFSNCLIIDQMLNIIDSYMFRSGGGRWRAAYNYPKDGDDITLHQQYGIAFRCGFYTFSIYDCKDGRNSDEHNDYCEYNEYCDGLY